MASESQSQSVNANSKKITLKKRISNIGKIFRRNNVIVPKEQNLVTQNKEEVNSKLTNALVDIEELHGTVKNQKAKIESQINELKKLLSEKDCRIQILEDEVIALRQRAVNAELKLEEKDCSTYEQQRHFDETTSPSTTTFSYAKNVPHPPPFPPLHTPYNINPPPKQPANKPAPPPVAPPSAQPPPPPPPPLPTPAAHPPQPTKFIGGLKTKHHQTSLQDAITSMKKDANARTDCSSNGFSDEQSRNSVSASSQVDDIVSQLKKGVKLRRINKSLKNEQLTSSCTKIEHPMDELHSVLEKMRKAKKKDDNI